MERQSAGVPFQSVGGSGIIMAVRCDSLTIDRRSAFGHRKIHLQDAWIGLYDGDFSPGKSEERFAVSHPAGDVV